MPLTLDEETAPLIRELGISLAWYGSPPWYIHDEDGASRVLFRVTMMMLKMAPFYVQMSEARIGGFEGRLGRRHAFFCYFFVYKYLYGYYRWMTSTAERETLEKPSVSRRLSTPDVEMAPLMMGAWIFPMDPLAS